MLMAAVLHSVAGLSLKGVGGGGGVGWGGGMGCTRPQPSQLAIADKLAHQPLVNIR